MKCKIIMNLCLTSSLGPWSAEKSEILCTRPNCALFKAMICFQVLLSHTIGYK